MKNNKKKFCLVFALVLAVIFIFNFTACGSVVPAAWVRLATDSGKVRYTNDMFGNTSAHIYYYENETDDTPAIEIWFSPRILGPDETDGVKNTIVDISGFYAMYINVYKNKSTYSASKAFYLNGSDTPLTPYDTNDEYDFVVNYEFENFGLIRGNPDGKINGIVNVIEYK